MKRQLLIGGLIAALAVAAWFVMAGDGSGGRGRGGTRGEEVTAPEREAPAAPIASAPAAEVAEEAPAVQEPAATQTRTSVSEDALARGIWVEGTVVFPPGTPLDERVFVEARGKKAADGEYHEVEVAPDGKFRVAFGEGTKTGRLALRGRYLYLEGGARWKADEPGPVVLEPLLGARIEGRVLFPAGEKAGKEDQIQLAHTRKTGSGTDSNTANHDLDAEGRFEIGGIARVDQYRLSFRGERHFGTTEDFTLEPGETARHELTLERGIRISGRITDEAGAPVKEAHVNAGRSSWQSEFDHGWGQVEDDGRFLLKALRPGKIQLTVSAQGFTALEHELGKLEAGEDQELTLVLQRGGSVSGSLLWPDGTPAVGFVSVDDGNDFGSFGEGHKTAEDGSFTITGLEAETVTLRARATKTDEVLVKSELTGKERTKKQKSSWNAEAEGVAVGTTDLVLTLAPSLELVGTVIEEGAGPVETFRLIAFPVDDGPMSFDFTRQVAKAYKDAGGAFTLTGFSPGKWRVTASSKEFVDSDPLEVEIPADAPVTLVLRRGATVSGVVVDASGAAVAGAAISWEVSGADSSFAFFEGPDEEPESDANGRFLVSKIKPGVVSFGASAPGHAPSEKVSLEVFAGRETSGIVLTLQQGGTITGEVVDFEGRPAAGARVWVYCMSGADFHQNAQSDKEGRFEISGAPAGRFRAQAELESGLELGADVELVAGASAHVRLAPETKNVVRLFGRITLGGEPIEGLRLSANQQDGSRSGANAETDEQGDYELQLPGGGAYRLSLHRWDMESRSSRNWSVKLDVPETRELRRDFAIPIAHVRGRVTSSAGDPLARIEITARCEGAEGELALLHANTHTAADGTYELAVSPGAVRLSAGGARGGSGDSQWSEVRQELTLASGQERSGVDFVLPLGGRLTGRVRLSDGTLAGQVSLRNAATGDWIGQSQDGGSFDFQGMTAGPLEIEAQGERGVSARPVAVTIVAGETCTVELELVPAVSVRVKLPGVPADAEPSASVKSADGRSREAWFGKGVLILPPLPRGSHTVTVELDGKRAERTFELRGDEGELEFELLLE